ncbi:MAG: hypothetical protein QOC96_2798 [Acidobacteriota bacterium]|jgi:hypothetical protein|nr:hypothetical protein [Acidobacteriota bacterium]
MDEQQKIDENTRRIVASNLTIAYFATEPRASAQRKSVDRKHAEDEIISVYSDFLIRLGASSS